MAGVDEERAPAGIDVTVPSVARAYDFLLGGTTNFAADRKLVGDILRRAPDAREASLANRHFLGRAVSYLAEAGVRQFIDFGAGLPTMNNVHEVAQRIRPDARVVYVDHDPIVLAHAPELLPSDGSAVVIQEDLREPGRILNHPSVRQMIDFSEPVAVMFLAVLHFVTRDEKARSIVSTLTERLAPGSYLTISHPTFDAHPGNEVTASIEERLRDTAPLVFRSRDAITRFFDGFDLVDPGLVKLTDWRSDDVERGRPGGDWLLVGVGRKR